MRARLLTPCARHTLCALCASRHYTPGTAPLSDDLLQLFGRAPETVTPSTCTRPLDAEQEATAHRQGATGAPWLVALAEFSAENYAHPGHVSTEICRRTLHALRVVYENPATRYLRQAGTLWSEALAILRHLSAPSLSDVWQVGVSLYYAEQYDAARRIIEDALNNADKRFYPEAQLIAEELQLLSLHTMSCAQLGVTQARRWQDHSCTVLRRAREIVAQGVQAHLHNVKYASCLLCYSYDWVCCFTPRVLGASDAEMTLTRLQSSMPPQLSSLCFTHECAVDGRLTSSRPLDDNIAPARLFRAAQEASAMRDGAALRRLYRAAVRREREYGPFGLFKLSTYFGNAVLRCSTGSLAVQARIVQRIGTSLDPSVLPHYSRIGGTRACKQAVAVLARRVAGVASYAALQRIVIHGSPAMASRVQERYGDMLTGKATATWRSALTRVDDSLALADGTWRSELPTTLRLLSDGGKWAACLRLLAEYDASQGTGQLCVAYALSQALRRSGRWWHAVEVVDLIAAAPVAPQCAEDEYFLEQACVHTLCALRDARRWVEALALYQMLVPAMQTQSLHVLHSIVRTVPFGAPWQKALEHSHSHAAMPDALPHRPRGVDGAAGVATRPSSCLVRRVPLMHDPDTRQQDFEMLVAEGRWRPLHEHALSLSQTRTSVERTDEGKDKDSAVLQTAWANVLRALLHNVLKSEVTERVLCDMSPSLLKHDRVLRLAFRVSCAYGWLADFAEMLHSIAASATPLAAQYHALVLFMLHNTPPHRSMLFDDSLVIHHFHGLATSGKLTLYLSPHLVTEHGTKASIAAMLRVPVACVALPHATQAASHSRAQGTQTADIPQREAGWGCRVYPVPALDVPLRHVLYCTADKSVLVGYKPAAAPLSSVARGAVRCVSASPYSQLYQMPPESSGLFVLRRASLAQRSLTVSLSLGFYLAPLSSTRSALLSARFFETYAMRVVCDPRADGRVGVYATCPLASADGTIDITLRQLLADVRAEGWGLVGDAEECGSGAFHVHEVELCIQDGDGLLAEHVRLYSKETSSQGMSTLYS